MYEIDMIDYSVCVCVYVKWEIYNLQKAEQSGTSGKLEILGHPVQVLGNVSSY